MSRQDELTAAIKAAEQACYQIFGAYKFKRAAKDWNWGVASNVNIGDSTQVQITHRFYIGRLPHCEYLITVTLISVWSNGNSIWRPTKAEGVSTNYSHGQSEHWYFDNKGRLTVSHGLPEIPDLKFQ